MCNNVMYQALHYANQQQARVPAGLFLVPASHAMSGEKGNIPSWSVEDLVGGVKVCLEEIK